MSRLKVKIVTHTGSDMPLEQAKKLGVGVIPDLVIVGETTYRNMLDLTSEEFYGKMRESRKPLTSSHPSVGDFISFFSSMQDCDEILFLSITSRMSGTYSTAAAAQRQLREQGYPVPITIYDTEQCSHGMGILVFEAARLAAEGMTTGEICHHLDEMKHRIGVYFVLETLKYARRGGRVGAIRGLAADALGIKPLVKFDEGTVSDIGINRNFKEGLRSVLEMYKTQGEYGKDLIIFHADNPDGAKLLETMTREEDPGCTIYLESVGPVIGLYTGAGCVGMAFWKKE